MNNENLFAYRDQLPDIKASTLIRYGLYKRDVILSKDFCYGDDVIPKGTIGVISYQLYVNHSLFDGSKELPVMGLTKYNQCIGIPWDFLEFID